MVVYRHGHEGLEVLVLHRAQHGPEYEGDWTWTPPAGCRLPGEALRRCALRELNEETGLHLSLEATPCGTAEWPVFVAKAPPRAQIVLDAEHDRHEWRLPDDAVRRCSPERVSMALARAMAWLRDREGRNSASTGSWGSPGS
ncbi:NUDIX domain-containing protein [Carboxydochorda subterranea]|uniref:NUDIX domain-containing protein n=1 Tax=Carboxydichorda subterranea TaxID=3109565 RepID=A0ABZ1C262_9FIRM|nr:NUDIX domain-containing protein [Limnochorda sp. L945t]WRP18948.1 NUDIX domain-containing protein [Limnochorda sp. L945t]